MACLKINLRVSARDLPLRAAGNLSAISNVHNAVRFRPIIRNDHCDIAATTLDAS